MSEFSFKDRLLRQFWRGAAACLLLLLLQGVVSARAQTVRVAAAADLQFALADLAGQYEKQTGVKLEVTYGSSGNFFAQIQNGAPFDVFFSADKNYPEQLVKGGLAEGDSYFVYGVGKIVLWVPKDSPLDPQKDKWNVLLDARVQKISVANPQHAPYGRAAMAALEKAGMAQKAQSKLVFGENISQAAQFVESGAAQAGIIARSLAISAAMKEGKNWEIPTDLYPPVEQAVVALKTAKDKNAASAFLEYLRSAPARATLARYGFELPATSAPLPTKQ